MVVPGTATFGTSSPTSLACQHQTQALSERGTPLTVNDYLAVRLGAVGVHATPGYLDAVEGTEITAQEWSSPLVKAATEAGLFAAALDNDRSSFCKERDLAQINYNLFGALQHEHPDWTLEQAMLEGIRIRDTMLALYLRLRERILPLPARTCASTLPAWNWSSVATSPSAPPACATSPPMPPRTSGAPTPSGTPE